jgi:hypothetical protein
MRNNFGRTGLGRRFVRILFCRVRPDICWIGLFALNLWYLAERMFFAGYAKEKHAERNTDDALAKEASHNALPQLSVSSVARKDESAGMPSRAVILKWSEGSRTGW